MQPIDLTPLPATEKLAAAPPMPRISEATPLTTPEDREAAFDAEFFWNGNLLHSFSIDRYGLFVSHRCAMGAPRLHLAMADGNAFYPDALRILWLCSAEPLTLSMLRRDPDAMEKAINEWAAENVPVSRAAAACGLALEIFNAAHENKHEPRHSAIDKKAPDSGN